jgi:hypothetical protein
MIITFKIQNNTVAINIYKNSLGKSIKVPLIFWFIQMFFVFPIS